MMSSSAQDHIALLLPSLRLGGAERVASLLANHWARKGRRVTVITFEDAAHDAFALDSAVTRLILGFDNRSSSLPAALAKNFGRVRALRRVLQERHIDRCIAFLSPCNACLAMAALGLGTLAIGTERTYPPAMPLGRARELARRWTYGWLDVVVAQTERSACWIRQHTRARQVFSISNPVVWPPDSPVAPSTDPLLTAPAGLKTAIAVGRLSTEKQFAHTIEAFAHAAPSDWRLVILGDGPMKTALQQQIQALGCTHRVFLAGAVRDIAPWMAAADLFIMASAFEGYPNALLEAMASGLACVAYDCPTGPRELMVDPSYGMLVPLNDREGLTLAISEATRSPEWRERVGRQAATVRQSNAVAAVAQAWDAIGST